METETIEARPAPTLADPHNWNAAHDGAVALLKVHTNSSSASLMHLRRDELQAIVQQAYDQFGILATPSYGIEAVSASGPGPERLYADASERSQS